MSKEYSEKVNDGMALRDQAAAFRRGARDLPAKDKRKLEELKKALSTSADPKPADPEKPVSSGI